MKKGTAKEFMKGKRRYRGIRYWNPSTFLRSRIGRQWNDVYSEICSGFPKGSTGRRKLEEWLRIDSQHYPMIHLTCWIGAETGKIYDPCGLELEDELFVHPFTGVLLYATKKVKSEKPSKPITRIQLDSERAYEKIEGIWYYTRFKKNDYYNPFYSSRTDLPQDEASIAYYTSQFHVYSKRQLSKKEIKMLRLNERNKAI